MNLLLKWKGRALMKGVLAVWPGGVLVAGMVVPLTRTSRPKASYSRLALMLPLMTAPALGELRLMRK